MRRWFAIIAGFVLLLGLVVFLAAGSQPALRFALNQAKAAGIEVNARVIRGNLFLGVEALDATIKSAFVNGSGATVKAKYDIWKLIQKKEFRLEAAVSGGRLSFDPVGLPPVVVGGEPAPISVFLDKAEVSDTELRFIGKNIFVPDAKITVLEQKALPNQTGNIRGSVRVKLQSKHGSGEATALYEFGKDLDPNITVLTQLDATAANFWLKPLGMNIQGGALKGTVWVTGSSLTADATLENGLIEVLPGLVVRGVAGRASFDEWGMVKAKLSGQGLGGSIETDFALNTVFKKENWKINGKLRPRLEQVMNTFAKGTPSKGALEITVSGGGWEKIKLLGSVRGLETLEAAGFPVQNLRGTWEFTDHFEATAKAVVRVGSDKLNAVANIKSVGEKIFITPDLTGVFLNAPLELSGLVQVLGDKIWINSAGTLLRGDANASLELKGEKITGKGNFSDLKLPLPDPVVSSINATASLSGTVNKMVITGLLKPAQLQIPGVAVKDVSGAYTMRFNGKALTLETSLGNGAIVAGGTLVNTNGLPARGNIILRGIPFEAGGKADYNAQYVLNEAGVALSGVARGYDLRFSEAELEAVSGVLSLSVGQQIKGRWNADKLLATFTDKSLNLRPRNWRVRAASESAFITGDMTLVYAGLRTSGKLEGKTRFGTITALGQGQQIGLSGNAGFNGLKAGLNGSLQLEPFGLRLVAVPQTKNLGGKIILEANKTVRVTGNLSSNGQNVKIGLNDRGLTAKGNLDLTALAPVLPSNARGLVQGIANIDLNGSSGTARVNGQVAGIPVKAQFQISNLRVSTKATVTTGQFAGATLTGRVFPSLNAQIGFLGVNAKVSGEFDDIAIAGRGTLPASVLEGTGLSLASNTFSVLGRVQNGSVRGSGQLGAVSIGDARFENGVLRANFNGNLSGKFQNEPFAIRGLNGNLEQRGTKLQVLATAQNASGVLASNAIQAVGLNVNFAQNNGANTIGFNASSASGTFSGVNTVVRNANGTLKLQGTTLGLDARATNATAQTPSGLVLASVLRVTASGTNNRLPIRFSAGQLEATGFNAKAKLEQVTGTLNAHQNLGWAAEFASGSVRHPEASVTIGAGRVAGNLRDQNLATRFSLPQINLLSRSEKANLQASGTLALNLEQPLQNWTGALNFLATGQDWRLGATGNWQNLRLTGTIPTRLSSLAGAVLPWQSNLALNGTLALPDLQYNLGFISSLPSKTSGLKLSASLKGKGTDFKARIEARGAKNGTGVVDYASTGTANLVLKDLNLRALVQTDTSLTGTLKLNKTMLRGNINGVVADLPISASWLENDAFRGQIGGSLPVRLSSAKWRFPLDTVLSLETLSSDLPIRARASLNLAALRGQGQLELLTYKQDLGNGELVVQPQVMPFQVVLDNGIRFRLENQAGALRLESDRWSGEFGLAYTAFKQAGRVTARVSGLLTKPDFNLTTTGLLQLQGSGTLEKARLTGRLALQPLVATLPKELRPDIQAGTARLSATWQNGKLAFTSNLENSKLEGRVVKLGFSGSLKNNAWSALGNVAVGTSTSSFEASDLGFKAPKLDLDLRLARLFGLDLSGRVFGRLALPKYELAKLETDLTVQNARGFNGSANGTFQASNGSINTNLRGTSPLNLEYAVSGLIYPTLEAKLSLGELTGQVTGSRLEFANRILDLQLNGSYLKKTSRIDAQVRGDNVVARASWDAATLNATGKISDLSASGTLSIADLQGIAGLAGRADAKLTYQNSILKILDITADAAGYKATGMATFADGALNVDQINILGSDMSAVGSGQIFPKLEAKGTAKTMFAFAPTNLTWSATGSLEQPKLLALGTLEEASIGLIAPKTAFEAQFDGQRWKLVLAGQKLSGVLEGGLTFISSANVRVDAPIVFDTNRLTASGNLAWNTTTGFSGGLNVLGTLFGQAGGLKLLGKQELEIQSTWQDLKLRATLPSQVGKELEAKLELERVDVGAFYGKPKTIFLEGNGAASGQWANPELVFKGLISSADKVLNSDLAVQYSNNKATLDINGKAIRGNGTWQDGLWQATAATQKIALTPYLPNAVLPKELEQAIISGAFVASGNTKTWKVSGNDLDLTASVSPVGALRLQGSATIQPETVQTNVTLEGLNGNSQIEATISNPLETSNALLSLKANLNEFDAARIKNLELIGLVSGTLNLEGELFNPNVTASLDLAQAGLRTEAWRVSSNLDATGRLLNPVLNGKAVLSGTGSGSFAWGAQDVLSKAPTISFNGLAEIPLARVQGQLQGALPNLTGQLEIRLPQLPEAIQLEGQGNGLYAVRSTDFANGTIKLQAPDSWLESAVSGKIRVNSNTDVFFPDFAATINGDVLLTGMLQKPIVNLEDTILIRQDATVLAAGSLYPTLNLVGTAESRFEFAPAKLEYRVQGSYEKPDVQVSGVLGTAKLGLIAPNTQLNAGFDGQQWRINLRGEAISGVLEGGLINLTRADLKLNAPIVYTNTNITALGTLSWDENAGFGGSLAAQGQLFGSDSKLELVGSNQLEAKLNWKNGLLRASIPSPASQKLVANWDFDRFDLGAWWQKPDQLFLAGAGKASGTWIKPEVDFAGSLESKDGSLNAKFNASYLIGIIKAQINGVKTKLEAEYNFDTWKATGKLDNVVLSALPISLIKKLETSLEFNANGNNQTINVNVKQLEASGELETIGGFTTKGAAQLQGVFGKTGLEGQLEVQKLEINALNGKATLNGSLGTSSTTPALFLTIGQLNLEPFGITGLVSGNLDLAGELSRPIITGSVLGTNLGIKNEKWFLDTEIILNRELFNPEFSGSLEFKGTGNGQLNFGASELFSSSPNFALSGNARLPFLTAKGSLAGQFPDIQGKFNLTLPTAPPALREIQLEGIKGSNLILTIQDVLQGQLAFIRSKTLLATQLRGEFKVNALLDAALEGLIGGTSGAVQGTLLITGSLEQPKAKLQGTLKNAMLSSVKLDDASLEATYSNGLMAAVRFKNGTIQLEGDTITATNVPLEVAGIRTALSASGRTSPFDLNFSGVIAGAATGGFDGRLIGDQLGLKLNIASNGIQAVGNIGTNKTGWTGQINLKGLPKATPIGSKALTGQAQFNVSGELAKPVLKGTGDVYGAQFALESSFAPLKATLQLQEAGSGSLQLENNTLSGTIKFQDEALKLELSAAGSTSIPVLNIGASVGEIRATGKARLENNAISANLELSDGLTKGKFAFEDNRILGELEKLSLSKAGLVGYGGLISLQADLRQDTNSDFGWQGTGSAIWQDLKTPLEVPGLNWKIDGTGQAKLSTNPVKVLLEYKGTPGLIQGDLSFKQSLWQGSLKVDLRGADGKGAVKGILRADEKGITGDLTAQNLPLSVSGIKAVVSGKVDLTGDSFNLVGKGASLGGDVELSGGGGLSDLLPLLESYTKTQPGDLPLNLRANLFTVRLQDVAQIRAVAPYLRGRVNGTLKIVGDVTNFQLNLPEFSLPDQNNKRIIMAANISGTLAGDLINYRGSFFDTSNPSPNFAALNLAGVGISNFSGRFNGKVATGQLELSRAPLHALVASILGEMPGTAYATGFARYEIPIADLLASTIKMDFVPLEVSGGGDTLTGKGRLIYSNRNLQLDDLILRGKGEWRINGNYAKTKVDLAMSFKDTVFTPILDLLPVIKDYDPQATGSLDLQLSGEYGKPNARVSLKDLTASISGIQLTAKELLGSLENGALQIRGLLTSDETLGATLDTTAKAKLVSYTPIQLENLEALATGSLNIKPIGLINNINTRIYGDSGGFKVEMTGKKGGNVSIKGDLSPRIKLKLEGKALVMPIPDYFVSDSLLDANLTFEGDGGRFYDVGGQFNIARLQTQLQQSTTGTANTTPTPKPSAPSNNKPNPFLQQVRFRGIEVIAPQGIRIAESFSTLEAGGKLVVTGTMANPELSGALEAVGGSGGRGTVRLGINTYTIQTAVAAFSAIEGIFPSIEIKSKGEVKASCTTLSSPSTTVLAIPIELTIRVRWLADTKNPNLKRIDVQPTVAGNCPENRNFRPLTAGELYSLVTLGSSNANLGGLAQQSLDTVLSVFILGELTRQIKAATGIDIDFSSNLIEVVAQNITDPTAQAAINFTLNFGIDLSRAVRLNVQLNNNRIYTDPKNIDKPSQLLGGAINLNWQSDDGRFGIRFGTPFFLPNPKQTLDFLDIIQPEAQFSFNLSNVWAISTTLGIPAANNFRITFGLNFRF